MLYWLADAVVQDSKVAQCAGIKYGGSTKVNEIVELGIDFDVFNLNVKKGIARDRLGLHDEQKMIFSPRSFRPNSNIENIIESIPIVNSIYKDVMYVFCRHYGDLETKYIEQIKHLGVEKNVKFTGFLDNELDMPY